MYRQDLPTLPATCRQNTFKNLFLLLKRTEVLGSRIKTDLANIFGTCEERFP